MHRAFGANIQVPTDHTGYPVQAGPVEPGSAHDITAARLHVLPALYKGRSPRAAHLGGQGLHRGGHRHSPPIKGGAKLCPDDTAYNTIQAGLCAPAERANALLKSFKALRKVSPTPSTITTITSTALVNLNLNNQP